MAPAAILTIAAPPPTGANNNLIYLKDSSSHIRYLIDTALPSVSSLSHPQLQLLVQK
jgi:hypothetical protein